MVQRNGDAHAEEDQALAADEEGEGREEVAEAEMEGETAGDEAPAEEEEAVEETDKVKGDTVISTSNLPSFSSLP